MAGDSRLVSARFMVEEMLGVEEVVTVSEELTGIVEFAVVATGGGEGGVT